MIRLIAILITLFTAHATLADTMRLAVTTSFENSGLADVLLPAIKEDIDLDVQLLVVGTGQALRLGQAGDVDAVLVHSKTSEVAFVAAGHATHRREIMYNDFVLIGPTGDPAKAATAADAASALTQIANAETPFVSRGDDSGTHKAELRLWASANLNPDTFDPWYRAVGAGMGAALNTASAMEAYIIADRASWLNFGNKDGLAIIFAGDPALFNQYAYLPINPAKHPAINHDAALALEAWLTSERAANLINDYTINNEALFVFNAN
jgi:tungstate transport system substrate-binding protein